MTISGEFVHNINQMKKIRVLVNPKSGLQASFDNMRKAIGQYWDLPGNEVLYQFCKSPEDGYAKAKQAVADEVDVVLVSGGDGTLSTISRALIGTEVAVGIIPSGSGNGFARHFEIPLGLQKAVAVLSEAKSRKIDVGYVNNIPFFITCSMAWDASIVRSFEKSPVRGILPYIFAGINEFLIYDVQPMDVEIDGKETVHFEDPMVFTIANLTQFGGGAKIAPHAEDDNGLLELVVALKKDMPILLPNINKLYDGTINEMNEIFTRSFEKLRVRRRNPTAIQIDGELVEMPAELNIKVLPTALKVLVPTKA